MDFLDYGTLRMIWWLLLGLLLIGFAVMDGFDLGAAALLRVVGHRDIERRVVLNTLGPVWEGNQVWLILGEGVLDHRDRRGLAGRGRDGSPHFPMGFFHEYRNFPNLGAHRSPSSPLISAASSPPERLCTRGPVVITSASSISSARGASLSPTSTESK